MLDSTIPALSLRAFESAHGLRVSIHDLRGNLWPFLEPDRFLHALPACRAQKFSGLEKNCIRFDVERLRSQIALKPEGAIKICHVGLVEWVVPTFFEDKLEWVVFAGARSAAPNLRPDLRENLLFSPPGELQPVEPDEAELILESLRQLVARLQLWAREIGEEIPNWRPKSVVSNPQTARATLIARFIETNATRGVRLGELAEKLGLSPERTGHLVRESCGATWSQLLLQARLRRAMGLLRCGDLPVSLVARQSGFEDVRSFTRVFAREIGTTPARYRRDSRV